MKSVLNKIAVVFGIIWLLVLIIWITLSIVLVTNKNEISKYIILRINQTQNGEIEVGQVSITPLRQFPHLSVNLENVIFYEHRSALRSANEQPIAKIENFYLGLDVVDLVKGNVNISRMRFEKGELLIVTYPDSSVNLLNAIKSDSLSNKKNHL